jgi:hypothetical protein
MRMRSDGRTATASSPLPLSLASLRRGVYGPVLSSAGVSPATAGLGRRDAGTGLVWLGLTLAILLALLASPLFAAGSIEATADKQKITVGEPFVYTVNMLVPKDAQADLPTEKAQFKGLEVRNYQPQQIPQPDGSLQIVLRYTLVCFDTGLAGIKDFRVPVRMPKGDTEKWLAPPVEVTVASVLPEKGDAQPKGFAGPFMLRSGWDQWLWAGLIALLIIGAVVAGILLWRRFRKERPVVEVERLLAPDEAALTALQRLRQDDLVARGSFLSFYQRLDEILRAWLQARFEIPAMGRTTMGTMYFLRVRREADSWRDEYLHLLRTADRVKFANVPPSDNEAYEDVEQAQEVIRVAGRVTAEAEASAPASADKPEGAAP